MKHFHQFLSHHALKNGIWKLEKDIKIFKVWDQFQLLTVPIGKNLKFLGSTVFNA